MSCDSLGESCFMYKEICESLDILLSIIGKLVPERAPEWIRSIDDDIFLSANNPI